MPPLYAEHLDDQQADHRALRCVAAPQHHVRITCISPLRLASACSQACARSATMRACLVRRFLKFQGPLSGQNQYVANNYTLTQPQGVRHILLR